MGLTGGTISKKDGYNTGYETDTETVSPLLDSNLLHQNSSTEERSPDYVDESETQPPGVMSILCLVALKKRLWLLPILTAGWLFSSFWISYAIAVSYNHTEVDFPYISHTAIEAPERCVFGQMVNIGAVMLAMNVILRYLFLKKCLMVKKTVARDNLYKLNLAGLVLGVISAFGLSMVANFQTKVQRVPHYIGAFLAFGCGTVYCWVQSSMTYRVHYKFNKERLLVSIQFINSFIMTSMLIIFATTKAIYKMKEAAGEGTKWDSLRGIYLTSTSTEWLLAFSILTFTLTFTPDFRHIQLDDPRIYLSPKYEKKYITQVSIAMSDTNSNLKIEPSAKVEPPTEEVNISTVENGIPT